MSLIILGNPADFDHWASLGNPGWSYEEVLPFFKKSERMVEPAAAEDTEHHSTKGPMSVELGGFHTESAWLFLEACKHLGLGRTQVQYVH